MAGFADFAGRLGKHVAGSRLHARPGISRHPKKAGIYVDERVPDCRYPSCNHAPTPQTFEQFINLWRDSDDDILGFAKQWGLLHLDRKGRYLGSDLGAKGRDFSDHEPFASWRYFSRRAFSVLAIAAQLRQGKACANAEYWQSLPPLAKMLHPLVLGVLSRFVMPLTFVHCDFSEAAPCVLEVQRHMIQQETELWLKFSGVCFALTWNRSRFEVEVDYHGQVLAFVGLQLALTVAGFKTLFICSGCGDPYVRSKKQPKPGEANFCDECGTKTALLKADQRRRERMQEARRLSVEGVSIAEITKKLKVRSPATVRRWIGKGK